MIGNLLYGRAHDNVKIKGDRVNFWEVRSYFSVKSQKEEVYRRSEGKISNLWAVGRGNTVISRNRRTKYRDLKQNGSEAVREPVS